MNELPMFTELFIGCKENTIVDGLPAPILYGCWIQTERCQLFCPVINITMSNNFKHSHNYYYINTKYIKR